LLLGAAQLPRPAPKARLGLAGLRAGNLGSLAINRVSCGLVATGQICFDTTGGFVWGGYWPKGSNNQYVYNSGFQVAGIIDPNAGFEWAGDTTGVFFFDPRGSQNGEPVRPILNSSNPMDVADWPDAARVPSGDASEELFDPLLRGRIAASQGDVWWLTWDGDPSRSENRGHPLGVLLEQRGMGWNGPSGNEDIIYFVYTLYNITSTDPADYAGVRPAMREVLLQKARDFHALNNAAFDMAMPAGGYSIQDLYVAAAADMDVGNPAHNFGSVNLPLGLGYTYDPSFENRPDWSFEPGLSSPPFFPGTGFAGIKLLGSPRDSLGRESGLVLFGTTAAGVFSDARSIEQGHRFLSGSLEPGDPQCNTGDPRATRICFIDKAQPRDLRFFQASGPFDLAPGEFASVAVAYIFAAPVAISTCPGACDIGPGDPTILGEANLMSAGANRIDSLAGYRGFDDVNGDGRVTQDEFEVVPRSLLGKALLAQTIFDNRFLVPFAPDPPEFFLVPGDGVVTVLWRPSAAETTGDPFFAAASNATRPDGTANPLYDPNFRQLDVEGYRVYRGRVNDPGTLTLLAQFDHAGTLISDYQGQVNPSPTCAPELGITTSCEGVYDSAITGVPRTRKVDHALVGELVQVRLGQRKAFTDGTVHLLAADTLFPMQSGIPALEDTGVPFVYVDRTARSHLRYFYSVTAFDVNSIQSGPGSLESPRNTRDATPQPLASNYENDGSITLKLRGRGQPLDFAAPAPPLDPATGRFGGPFPPADGFDLQLVEFVRPLLADAGSASLVLDSLALGSPFDGIPARYFMSGGAEGCSARVELALSQSDGGDEVEGFDFFDAIPVNPGLAARFHGSHGFTLQGRITLGLPGAFYAGAWGAGCSAGAEGFVPPDVTGCEYNGPRWFDGPSPEHGERREHPQAGHPEIAEEPGAMAELGNAGELTGVRNLQIPRSYQTADAGYHLVEAALAGAFRAADFNLYWGAAGRIDSVVDVTHNVAVPFDSLELAGSWGVLNPAATTAPGSFDGRPDVLTITDLSCVEPLRSFGAVGAAETGLLPCESGTRFFLSQTAVPGPIAIWDRSTAQAREAPPRPGAGFVLYLAGIPTIFELESGLPEAGAVWSLRSYVGAIAGGRGAAGDRGPYQFTPVRRPFTAVGAELRLEYQVANLTLAAAWADLRRVHTVPDPYYVTSPFDPTPESKTIRFVNLPQQAIIRIYSSSGILVAVLRHDSRELGSDAVWNVRNRNDHVVASGVYFYHVESGDARRVGRFTVVNFAE
jgi:hypothetical protein